MKDTICDRDVRVIYTVFSWFNMYVSNSLFFVGANASIK